MIDMCEKAIQKDPEDVPSMMFLASYLTVVKKYDEAIDILKRAMTVDPETEPSCTEQIQAIQLLIVEA